MAANGQKNNGDYSRRSLAYINCYKHHETSQQKNVVLYGFISIKVFFCFKIEKNVLLNLQATAYLI